ncbi:unnamed protein product, partial [Durusdinium trenchii]
AVAQLTNLPNVYDDVNHFMQGVKQALEIAYGTVAHDAMGGGSIPGTPIEEGKAVKAAPATTRTAALV